MVFKNIIFETDKKGLDNILQFWNNPEGRIDEDYPKQKIHLRVLEGKSHPYRVKILATDKINHTTYDNLILQLVYNDVNFHNIKFYIPEKETETIEKFLFDRKNKHNGKNKYYLQHMIKGVDNDDKLNQASIGKKDKTEKKVYTAKISCYKKATKEDIIKLTSFMRQYL